MVDRHTLYQQAKARVDATPELQAHADLILDEWDNTGSVEDHYEWVSTAPAKEVQEWAESIADELEHTCAYCSWVVDTLDAPSAGDDEAWERIAPEHHEDCEWVYTRAHRINV